MVKTAPALINTLARKERQAVTHQILALDLDTWTDPQLGVAVVAYFLVIVLAAAVVIQIFEARPR